MQIEKFWAWYFGTTYSDWIRKYDELHSVYETREAQLASQDAVRGDKRAYQVYGVRLPNNQVLVLGKIEDVKTLRS